LRGGNERTAEGQHKVQEEINQSTEGAGTEDWKQKKKGADARRGILVENLLRQFLNVHDKPRDKDMSCGNIGERQVRRSRGEKSETSRTMTGWKSVGRSSIPKKNECMVK